MTTSSNFKKQIRERQQKTGESYQEARRQLLAAATKHEQERRAVFVEIYSETMSRTLVHQVGHMLPQGMAASGDLLVRVGPWPNGEMPRLRSTMVSWLPNLPCNDPALTNGKWRRITQQEAWVLFGPMHNPNDELSLFSAGRFVRKMRWREVSAQRWEPLKPHRYETFSWEGDGND